MKYLLLALIVVSLTGCGKFVSVHFSAIDEEGAPVPNAQAIVGYLHGYTWTSSGKEYKKKGETNELGMHYYSALVPYRDGIIPFMHMDEIEDIFSLFKKEGYYDSRPQYIKDKDVEAGRWAKNSTPLIVQFRKKLNPIPMYARDTSLSRIDIPVVDKEVGFDLIKFDWVSPYGKGIFADFIFKLDRDYRAYDNFTSTLTVTFTNKYDGMLVHEENREYGSLLKLPRFAPELGYLPKFQFTKGWDPLNGNQESNKVENNYFFRVRSEEKNGKFVQAMYGKIHGDIRFDPRGSETAAIVIRYYLNPDYTRNMEFGRNLFKGQNVGMD